MEWFGTSTPEERELAAVGDRNCQGVLVYSGVIQIKGFIFEAFVRSNGIWSAKADYRTSVFRRVREWLPVDVHVCTWRAGR